MKLSKMNEDEAALIFEERKKKLIGNLIEQYTKVQKQQPQSKNNILSKHDQSKQHEKQKPSNECLVETSKEIQLKKIVKSSLLKDIGNIDMEIQKMTNEHNTNRSKPLYLEKQYSHSKILTKTMNQTELSKSEQKTSIQNRNQSYYTNRQKFNKINSVAENSYSKLAESIRNLSNQRKGEERKTNDFTKPYDFLQIKTQSEKIINKPKTKSVNIEANVIKQSKVVSSERKIPKPPLKQLYTKRNSESEKTSPVKTILKQTSNHTYDLSSTKANTTQQFYQHKDNPFNRSQNNSKIGDYKILEAVNIYKTLKQLVDSKEQNHQKYSTTLLQQKTSTLLSHKNVKQQQ
ncbi:unnamed protein product [Paramecium pentaurelia]|uniref:Uncharacterized protein n=1 Tax=Paramecium pentaurelia TaxID=43138 RepID=A0A8S1YBM3_9CILI|nr:unnamed protein product [Paramecium pentaurelia]